MTVSGLAPLPRPSPSMGARRRDGLNIHVSSTPKHLKITPTMVDDFLIDPVMGAKVILNLTLDAFQAVRMRTYWWVPDVIDSSGFGTGKSIVFWAFMQLRCIVIGDQWVVSYYQTFQAGKDIYWPYYSQFNTRTAPIFAAQLGKLDCDGDTDGKDNTRGPACYKQHFKNESIQFLPAPNWLQDAKGQAGLTFNVAGIDEWTKVETMTKKTGRTVTGNSGQAVGGINQQILGRVRRGSWNQHHRLWGNHRVFLATAESTMHPGYERYRTFEQEIAKGNPNYATISFNFKDFSNLKSHSGKPFKEQVPDWSTIQTMRTQFTRAHWLREGLGLWARETKGWYSEEDLDRCVALGVLGNLQPEIARDAVLIAAERLMGEPLEEHLARMISPVSAASHYFLGIDPAPAQSKKADDGGLAVLRVRPKPGLAAEPTSNLSDWLPEFVWAYRARAMSTRQWSGFIHQKHRHFHFSGIMLDPGGGGQWILTELNKSRQLIAGVEMECTPIASLEDISTGNATFILNLFKRSDVGISSLWPVLMGDDNLVDAAHVAFQEAIEHILCALPQPFNERPASETASWPEEKQWALKNLDAGRHQLNNIHVAVQDNGLYALTRHQAKQFSALGKKDIAMAMIFAWVRFLIWLKMGELEFSGQEDGETGFYVH